MRAAIAGSPEAPVSVVEPPLWTGEAFVAAIGGRLEGDVPARIEGISIDSRSIGSGEAFFAILGDRFDGHAFVADALAGGAAIAVVSAAKRHEIPDGVGPLLVVDGDVLPALERLAAAARARSTGRIIAVTGSVGKTSTKEALRRTLGESGSVHASSASFNNHWGVPLSLARLPETDDFGVFEIGMNHAGEITPLTKLVRPHIAIITTVDRVHLEHFDSVKAIAEAKAEIFSGLEPGGIAIINADNAHFRRLAQVAGEAGARIVSFGASEGSDARVVKSSLGDSFSAVTAEILGETMTYKIGAPGAHLVDNSLAVLAAVKLAGADIGLACLSLQDLEQPKGRGRRHRLRLPTGEATLIDESYNANPASMRAALRLLGLSVPTGTGRRIAVLGDMLELGEESPRLHRRLAPVVRENAIDLVHTAGRHMSALHNALPEGMRGLHEEAAARLRKPLLAGLRAGDVVMIKGSFGSRMAPLVEALIEAYGTEPETH
ncbi:UDP-N-acetylmuramoylalanyl-D-glutamyl-2,6-diaminopimelate--D-alanyl-D-alanine ligase [Methylobrevis pamukkalensis]|uniref:UDP-N-acetylmuramoylalanyl-D-glutamyl-2, 6-diaminopimelate--D-alanyl-D-alanine ligase n=1 Tax=Methylobrevis pamukkalensis TaxID=1439726 RepID=UPI001FDA4009|nr:UDP-N-acetylmuramoylalanyl-D-glutamyl-2,6-diaminopimelate--D-alanyl-D-alanine ligase [Methylobrevis pamukkalensis]